MTVGLVYREYSYDLFSRPGYTSGVSSSARTQAAPQFTPKVYQPPDRQIDDKSILSNTHTDVNSDDYVLGGEKYSLLEQIDCVQEIMVAEKLREGQKRLLTEEAGIFDKNYQNADSSFSTQDVNISNDSRDYDIGASWRNGSDNYRTDTESFNRSYPYQKDRTGFMETVGTTGIIGASEVTRGAATSQLSGLGGPTITEVPSAPLHLSIDNLVVAERDSDLKLDLSLGATFDIGTGNLSVNFNRTREMGNGLHMEKLAQDIMVEQKVRQNDEMKKIADQGDDRFQDPEAKAGTDQAVGRDGTSSRSEEKESNSLVERAAEYQLARDEIRLHHKLEYIQTPPQSALIINPLPPTLELGIEALFLAGSSLLASPKNDKLPIGDYITPKDMAASMATNMASTGSVTSRMSSVALAAVREPAQSYKADGPPVALGLESTDTYNLEFNPIPTTTESYDVTTLNATPIYLSTDHGSFSLQRNPYDLENSTNYRQMSPIILNLQRQPMSDELDRDRVNLVLQSPPEQSVQVVRPENHFDHTSHFMKLTRALNVHETPRDFVTTEKHITQMHNPEKHVDNDRTEKITENQLYGRDDPRIQEVVNLREIRQMDRFEKQINYMEGRHTSPVELVRNNAVPNRRAGDTLSGLVWGWNSKQ